MLKISVIGAGSFGTAMSVVLSEKGYDVSLYDRNKEIVNCINKNRKNSKYLSEITIPSGVEATCDMKKALMDSEFIILAIPSQGVRDICKQMKDIIMQDQIIVNLGKGIEKESLKTLSLVIREELKGNDVVVLSGPSHAEEVCVKIPTALVAASDKYEISKKIQDIFMTDYLRVYTGDDVIGVEVAGAVKNVIALCAGISDGIGYGDNTKAALMTRGMNEIIKIGLKMGGRYETFMGLAGFGDLIVTCTSMHSRNRRCGILIGKGYSCDEAIESIGMTVEGINACRAFYALKKEYDVDMPIVDALYKVLFENFDVKEAVYNLMTRNKKSE